MSRDLAECIHCGEEKVIPWGAREICHECHINSLDRRLTALEEIRDAKGPQARLCDIDGNLRLTKIVKYFGGAR